MTITETGTKNGRSHYTSGGPFEEKVGYSRAVRVGNLVFVSGTTGTKDGKVVAPGDIVPQTERIVEVIGEALAAAGASFADVVRYRAFLVDVGEWEAVAGLLRESFGVARPTNTLIGGAQLIDPGMRIEIECDAVIDDGRTV